MEQSLKTIYSAGKDPEELAEEVKAAMEKDQFYIIPYPEARPMLQNHFEQIIASLPRFQFVLDIQDEGIWWLLNRAPEPELKRFSTT